MNGFFLALLIYVIGFQGRNSSIRDSGKIISYWNFVVIAMFYGGAWRGCIMILESINRSGRSSFQKELGVFLTSEKPKWGR